MIINKTVSCTLSFDNETLSDYYLASALHKYIEKRNKNLENYIGYRNDDNPNGINDFLYTYSSKEVKILKEIEGHIAEFIKDFELVAEELEERCNEESITDDVEFFEQFEKLSKVFKAKKDLEDKLVKKGDVGKKHKV